MPTSVCRVFHMQSINRSECPRELEPTDRNIPVNVNLVKRITEDWQVSSYGHCGDVMDSGCVWDLVVWWFWNSEGVFC
jgi:hypothetical protein